MYKFFVKQEQIQNETIDIIGEDVNHIKNVLRLAAGDMIEICDYDSKQSYLCNIDRIEKESVLCEIQEKVQQEEDPNIHIHIFQGLPKADKMEFIIQKATEIGIEEITPVIMHRSIVKINPENECKKIQRWQKIAEASAKQSKRNDITQINDFIKLKDICSITSDYDIVLIPYENEKENRLKEVLKKVENNNRSVLKIAVVIGPEGGFEEEEIENLKNNTKYKVITLGKRILRTETVAIFISSIIMYELGGI